MLSPARQLARDIYFFLTPNFSMMAFSVAVEALRLTNRVLGSNTYRWHIVSKDGQPVAASNGIAVNTTLDLEAVRKATSDPTSSSMVIVCAGIEVEKYNEPVVFGWLRRLYSRGAALGGLCTAAHILARAGLLDGRRCAIHWENLPGFSEQFPDVAVRSCLFEVDQNIYTCAGGTSSLDMMLHLIGSSHGEQVVARVCELCLIDRIRPAQDRQRLPIGARVGVQNPRLLSIIELMEANVSEPLSLAEISDVTGISRRHVERLFRQFLGRSPARYYLDVRLERARRLLRHSNLPIVEVAIAAGFVSASHFSKRYRERYDVTPQADRREFEPDRAFSGEFSASADEMSNGTLGEH
ncbi:MAG: helix-turn-helix domain-containing protein [Rhizobiales bacterium]|nr:helix-turn-helix domain-containing protein [Hyphomicrobiales bacterium]